MAKAKKVWEIAVTEEQQEVIKGIFTFHGWDLEELGERPLEQYIPTTKESEYTPSTSSSGCGGAGDGDHGDSDDDYSDDQDDSPALGPNHCQYCFLNPCVTTRHQAWLGNGQQPRAGNNLLRKDRYKKYWSVMDHYGGWNIDQYLRKKKRLFRSIRSRQIDRDTIVETRREIMPECILKQVRGLYPNLPGQPYMGHTWQ